MMVATLANSNPFTRTHVLIAVSLVVTWWLAHILPHYKPMIRDRIQDARQAIPGIKIEWNTPDGPDAMYDRRKVALLIEPRIIPHVVPQILHMITVVPPDWRFVYVGSPESVIGVNRSYAIKHQQVIRKLDLMVLPEPWSVASKEMVHRTLTDMRFYDEFLPGIEWILKYESDSILCSNSELSLNDWLHWSWTGAPRTPDDRFAGNGGLSLRRVSAIRQILSAQSRQNDSEPEDEWFGYRLWTLPGAKVASGTENALAVEDVYMETPMGYHIRDGGSRLADSVWQNQARRQSIFDYCPELSLIMDMKLKSERCSDDDGEGHLGPSEEEKKKQEEEERKKQEEEERKKQEEEERKKQEEEERKNGEEKKQEEEKKKQEEDKKKQEEEKKKQEGEKKKQEEEKKQPAKVKPEKTPEEFDPEQEDGENQERSAPLPAAA